MLKSISNRCVIEKMKTLSDSTSGNQLRSKELCALLEAKRYQIEICHVIDKLQTCRLNIQLPVFTRNVFLVWSLV